jgi:hypothetical protein
MAAESHCLHCVRGRINHTTGITMLVPAVFGQDRDRSTSFPTQNHSSDSVECGIDACQATCACRHLNRSCRLDLAARPCSAPRTMLSSRPHVPALSCLRPRTRTRIVNDIFVLAPARPRRMSLPIHKCNQVGTLFELPGYIVLRVATGLHCPPGASPTNSETSFTHCPNC